jgi:Na+-transporting methylmalonyl-CoA/oxaloacetate decarboxylase gamma subunit
MSRAGMTGMANNKISKKGTFGTTMGIASVIAILVVLVLIVFAALSIVTAKADLKLSQKTAESTEAFYIADSAAEEKLAKVAAAAKGGEGWEAALGEDYSIKADGDSALVSYEVPIDAGKSLSVRLRVYAGGDVVRELWQVRSTTEWKGDNDVKLIIE